jgi:hypothetical protein
MQSLIAGDDFQHILRVLNTNVDGKQKVMYAITAIRGIGRRFSNLVCKKAEVDMRKRCGRSPDSRSRGRKAAATGTATAAVAADQMPVHVLDMLLAPGTYLETEDTVCGGDLTPRQQVSNCLNVWVCNTQDSSCYVVPTAAAVDYLEPTSRLVWKSRQKQRV